MQMQKNNSHKYSPRKNNHINKKLNDYKVQIKSNCSRSINYKTH